MNPYRDTIMTQGYLALLADSVQFDQMNPIVICGATYRDTTVILRPAPKSLIYKAEMSHLCGVWATPVDTPFSAVSVRMSLDGYHKGLVRDSLTLDGKWEELPNQIMYFTTSPSTRDYPSAKKYTFSIEPSTFVNHSRYPLDTSAQGFNLFFALCITSAYIYKSVPRWNRMIKDILAV